MRFLRSAAGAAVGICLVVAPVPAFAAPLAGGFSSSVTSGPGSNSLLIQVQSHPRRGGGHRGDGGHRGGGGGNAAGAAAAGAAIGVFMGAIIASEAQRHQAIEYCMRRYRSYNSNTGTWVDRHGRVRSCP
jgi:hypothetical protein